MTSHSIKKAFSITIIGIVFLSTFGTTFLIIKKGVTSDTSNYKIAKTIFSKFSVVASADSVNVETKKYCKVAVSDQAIYSVVDFLNSNKIPSSFFYREALAEKAGIKNYTGSNEENIKLLDFLVRNNQPNSNCEKT